MVEKQVNSKKSQSKTRKFVFVILLLAFISLAAFLSGCGQSGYQGSYSDQTTSFLDDQDRSTTTGGLDDQGRAYTGFVPSEQLEDVKKQVPTSDSNKVFAEGILKATIVPALGKTDTEKNDQKPIALEVQMKNELAPAIFQGVLVKQEAAGKAAGGYTALLVDRTGNRPDLHVSAECNTLSCDHSQFFLSDDQKHTAAIVITKEERVLRLKLPAGVSADSLNDCMAQQYKQGKYVIVTATQIIPGRSYYEVREEKSKNAAAQNAISDACKSDTSTTASAQSTTSQNGNNSNVTDQANNDGLAGLDDDEGPVLLSGPLLEADWSCTELDQNNVSHTRKGCLVGNDEEGDLFFRFDEQNQATQQTQPPSPSTQQSQTQTQVTGSQSETQGQAPSKTNSNTHSPTQTQPTQNQSPLPFIGLELERPDQMSEEQKNTPPSANPQEQEQNQEAAVQSGQCPIPKNQNSNSYLANIYDDCTNPVVMSEMKAVWIDKQQALKSHKVFRGHDLLAFLKANELRVNKDLKPATNKEAVQAHDLDVILKVLETNQLPDIFSFITVVESGLDRNAANKTSHASGYWQIMPSNALRMGLTVLPPIPVSPKEVRCNPQDQRCHPYTGTQVASKLLRDYLNKWNGDVKMALASYNAGPVTAERLTNKYNKQAPDDLDMDLEEAYSLSHNFWVLRQFAKKNTAFWDYVPDVLSAIFAGVAPQAYGIAEAPQGMEWK